MGNSAVPTFFCGFTWTVENFPSIKDKKVESPIFSGGAGGTKVDWGLLLYPNGVDKASEGYVSLFLCLVSCKKAMISSEIEVSITLSIFDQQNMKHSTMSNVNKFNVDKGYGYASFVKRNELVDKTNGLLVDDNLRIHCTIQSGTLLKYNSLPSMEQRNALMPKSSFSVDFWQLYINQVLVDVTVEVSGKEFKIHKDILAARSPVFASMFGTDMAELNSNRVVISDIEPEVFVELLRFIYTDQAENLDLVACGLLACSEKYALERLKFLCEESIVANLSVEKAADVLLTADLHRAPWLKRKALEFIRFHALKITQTEEWKVLINHPHLLAEAFQSLALNGVE